MNDQQTQLLPEEADLRQRIIDTLGFTSWNEFIDVLNEKRQKVKVQFKQLIEDTSSNAATENFGQLEQQLDEVLDDNAKI